MASKKKLLTSGIAVVSAAALLFGGTFAWQSISQTALNEISASVNPGGRLHDDFNDITASVTATGDGHVTMTYDKNVYVENFTEYAQNGVQVYARVRLDEYMELGQNAGKLDGTKKAADNRAVSVVAGAELDDKTTWTTHKIGQENDESNPFHQYWSWEMGGEAVTYMPTFNKNKDSLEADINGSFAKGFKDYVDYANVDNAGKTGIAIYDADAAEDGDEVDELGDTLTQVGLTLSDVIDAGSEDDAQNLLNKHNGKLLNVPNVSLTEETHEAKATLSFGKVEIISMADWKQLSAEEQSGNYWVYDEDGWAYWANPIDPETATGPLLNGIQRTEKIINQDWYYAINVVAQFITYDDMGRADNTGFYDLNEGSCPTADALTLLKAIGVDVGATVADETALIKAMAEGESVIILTDNITLTKPLKITDNISLNLNGCNITSKGHFWNEDEKNWSLISVDGGSLDIYNNGGSTGGLFADEEDCYCVDVRNGGELTINGGTFKGNISAVYVFEGKATINGGNFSIRQTDNSTAKYKYLLNCYDENYVAGKAKITVNGGNFSGGPWSEVPNELGGFVPFYDGFDPAVPCEADGNSYLGEGVKTIRTQEIDQEKFEEWKNQEFNTDEITAMGTPQRWLVMVVPAG